MNANLSQIPLIRLCSYLILGTATALKIRGQSLLADIREFRHFKKKRREDEAVIDVPERLLADLEDPLLEDNAADVNLAGQLADFGHLMRRNQADEEDITMRENEGRFLQLPEDRSDDFFGAPPAPPSDAGEIAPITGQGLFDDDNMVPPVDVTAAANEGPAAAAPDAPLRTNGIANPEDAAETPAVEEADNLAGGRRRPRKRPPPPNFSDSEETETAPPIPDAQPEPLRSVTPPPPDHDAQPPPEAAMLPPDNADQMAPVPEGIEDPAPAMGRNGDGDDLELLTAEQPVRKPKNKRRRKKGILGGPLIDLAGNLQVNIKANMETGDETIMRMEDMMPRKQFPSVKVIFAKASRKCGGIEISSFFGVRARQEESEQASASDGEESEHERRERASASVGFRVSGEESERDAEPADVPMQDDAPLGQSDHAEDQTHSRLRAGTSAQSLEADSASIQAQDLAVSGLGEASVLNPIHEEVAAAEEEEVAVPPPTRYSAPAEPVEAGYDDVEMVMPPPMEVGDNDVEMMPPPPPAGARSVRSEESDAESLPSGVFDEMGPIEREVLAALGDMGHGGRSVPFNTLVDSFNSRKSVARVFGLLLSMDKRRLVEMEQEEDAGFGGAIGIRKI